MAEEHQHLGDDGPVLGVTLPRFSAGDMFKFAAAVVFIAMAWARMETGLGQIEARLDKMEQLYVRRDVNEEAQKTINTKLDAMRLQLEHQGVAIERVEMKLEK